MKPIEEKGTLWRYDVISNAWSDVSPADPARPYPAGRSYHCTTTDKKSKIYVHAGCPESGRLADLWAFDIPSRTWVEFPAAPGPARGGASMAFLDDKLYRMNGFDGQCEQGGSLDVFDLSTAKWTTTEFVADGVSGPEARSVATLLPVTFKGKKALITMFGEHDPSSLGHAGAGKMLSDAWIWDLGMARWQRLETTGTRPQARGWFDADVVDEDGNEVVVYGGLDEGNNRLGDAWKLCISSGRA